MIGIHDTPGSFSDRWIEYCSHKLIPFTRIHCLASDVMQQCEGLAAVFWHWSQIRPSEPLVARQIVAALEKKGITVFPNMATCMHFDDKVAQKYLLEAVGAPLVPTWVFFDPDTAMKWIGEANWPKVFKLRCGASSTNVRLVRSRSEAEAFCRQAFGRGFPAVAGYLTDMRARLHKAKSPTQFWGKLRRAPRTITNNFALRRQMPRQRGYLYFQEFLPGNTYDTRITVIGDRAFGFMRMNRPGDFRASGSGTLVYDPVRIDQRCVKTAFQVADRLATQSLALDFVFNPLHEPMICEISYCYIPSAVQACKGYWDHHGTWHEGHVWPQDAIIEDVVAEVNRGRSCGSGC